MNELARKVNLVLIADRPDRAGLLQDIGWRVGVGIDLRRLMPGPKALRTLRNAELDRHQQTPDAIFFDFSHPDENAVTLLREIAFGEHRVKCPVVLITSPESQAMLEAGDVDGGKAVMFSPTGIISFVSKMRYDNRDRFFKALRTLYQFGPILVRAPRAVLYQDSRELVASA